MLAVQDLPVVPTSFTLLPYFMDKDRGINLLEESLTNDKVGRGPPVDRRNNGDNERPLISASRSSSRADMIPKMMFYS